MINLLRLQVKHHCQAGRPAQNAQMETPTDKNVLHAD
jgi:hypothetical protein